MISGQIAFTLEAGLLLLSLTILVGPLLAERVRIPGLVGLIFIGMVLGPFVFAWLRPDGFVATVGAAGLLYLMFLAGVELDLVVFRANRSAALTFGALTFLIPFGMSFLFGQRFLGFGVTSAALLGAMWSSHTIVAYPEAKAAGLSSNRAVGSAVASTIITDVIALVILAVAVSAVAVESVPGARAGAEEGPLPLWLGLIVLVVFTLWILPRVCRWLFLRVATRSQRFVVALAAMSAGALVSLLGGIEGLVGAFLAGIGINRLIPSHGELMERVEFFGSALFVPAFLVAVGLSIDPRSLIQPSTVMTALGFTALVVVGKSTAALISGRIFGFSWPEIGVMSTLTMGQAAATLAIAQVGVETRLFSQEILNAAVLTVVFTVLITSFGTRYFASRVPAPDTELEPMGAQVLVQAPLSATDGAEEPHPVMRLAVQLAQSHGGLVTPFALSGVDDDEASTAARLRRAVSDATSLGQDTEGLIRHGITLAEAARNLTVESGASILVLPWSGPTWPRLARQNASIDQAGRSAPVPVVAASMRAASWERVVLVTGRFKSIHGRVADVALAHEIAHALLPSKSHGVHVLTTDESSSRELLGPDAAIGLFVPGSDGSLTSFLPTDLVVAPSHAALDISVLGSRSAMRVFDRVSLLVVGAAGRLSVGRSSIHQMNLGVAPSRDSITPP